MHNDNIISGNYAHGGLLSAIESSLARLGKITDSVTLDELAAVDEFHIGGRAATAALIVQLNITSSDVLLDVGCGLGGARRAMWPVATRTASPESI